MKIELQIGSDTLGDYNTDADNQRYAAAVQRAIEAEYPGADVDVEIVEHSSLHVSGLLEDEYDHIVSANVKTIKRLIWERGEY